jgi:hypothetical protein
MHIDTNNPLHAAAYLRSAAHFLSRVPEGWSAERLALALVDEESQEKGEILLWGPIERAALTEGDDPHLYSDQLISDLAESMLEFLEENR